MDRVPLMGPSKVPDTSPARKTAGSLSPWISCHQIVRVAPSHAPLLVVKSMHGLLAVLRYHQSPSKPTVDQILGGTQHLTQVSVVN